MTEIEASATEDHNDLIHLFYGGGARVPGLQKLLEKRFEKSFLKSVNLDEGASYGGGLLAARAAPGFRTATRFSAKNTLRPELFFNSSDMEILEIDGLEYKSS